MKINSLKIKEYKRLKDFEIEFHKPISILIGKNGSGKSSLLEALAWIFRSANLTYVHSQREKTPFEFQISYSIKVEEVFEQTSTSQRTELNLIGVTLTGNNEIRGFWKIETDNSKYSLKDLIKKIGYIKLLPTNLLIYYSGWFETMEIICKEHENLYIKNLREIKSDNDINISSESLFSKVSSLPILYIQKYHFEILLACLYSYQFNDRLDAFFNNTLKLVKPEINTLGIFIKKRVWRQGANADEFWGAKGELRGFLELLRRYAKSELLQEKAEHNNEDQIQFIFDLNDWYKLREFYGEEKKLFYLLHMLHASEILGGLQIFLDRPGATISQDHLSEGEQQVITIKAINELLIEENSLVLLDEPDTYLHPHWQSQFMNNIYGYTDLDVFETQYIISSHSPIILSNLKDGDLYKMTDGIPLPIQPGYFGKDYGFNLFTIMDEGQRNTDVQNELDQVFELIEGDDLDKAQELINKLAEIYKDEPELTKAQTMVNFLKE